MIRSILARSALGACLIAVPVLGVACSGSNQEAPAPAESAGTMAMNLITHVGDHTYHLSAEIAIYGPVYRYLYTYDYEGNVLKTELPTGEYEAHLYWWQLERQTEDGNWVRVEASALTDFVPFTIFNQGTTSISFQFETDGVLVPMGSGNLGVTFEVGEVPGACTILGAGCDEGYWCAPPELTGSPLQCLAGGETAVGESCTSPWQCVASASCFDFGAGPVCGALCSKDEFGSACATGGDCVKAGEEYGVCVPEGGTPPTGGGEGGSGGEGGFGFAGDDAGGFGGSF